RMQHVLVQVQQPILVQIQCQQVVLFTTSLHHSIKVQRPFFLLLHYRLPNDNGHRLSFTTRPQHRPGFLPIPYCCGCHTGCGRFGSFVLTKPVSRPLSSGGLHRRVQQVLDIDRFYNLVTETLICSKCRRNYLSWNREILEQLDMAHRSEFRVILTRQYVDAFV
ncbi:hypothetical protein XENOCAPTIV_029247, partial [Xenoophorus captivus]